MDTPEDAGKLKELYQRKSDMVSMSAHQIRTSLAAQKWIIKMFLDGDLGSLTAEQESLLQKAYESNDRAISVVSELLLANKTEEIGKEKYQFADFDLAALVGSAVFDFSGEAYNKGVEIIFLPPASGLGSVRADKEKIRVVLQNLLENAIKYSNMHGKIFVTVADKDGMCQVSVKDTGVGISEEGRTKLFQKFYRDEEAKKKEISGSGIGLFTSKEIVEAHGGKIWFESKEGEGTTFLFTIPMAK